MSSWTALISSDKYLIGEVAHIEDDIIDVFVYPERFKEVSKGSILLIDSGDFKPVGIVLKTAHSSRYGSFAPLRLSRESLEDAYPDIKNYHKFVTTILYTSVLKDGKISHFRYSAPLLHDQVYIIKDHSLLEHFFKPRGEWDFSFLEYLMNYGASHLDLRELFFSHLDFFKANIDEVDLIISSVSKYVSRHSYDVLEKLIEDLEVMLNVD
jgi:hypothetical protein